MKTLCVGSYSMSEIWKTVKMHKQEIWNAAEPRSVVIYEPASTAADISSLAETLIFELSLRADFFPLKWFSKCSESTFKNHYIASCLLCLRTSGSSWILGADMKTVFYSIWDCHDAFLPPGEVLIFKQFQNDHQNKSEQKEKLGT